MATNLAALLKMRSGWEVVSPDLLQIIQKVGTDPATLGHATAVFNIDAIGLCGMVSMLNRGFDLRRPLLHTAVTCGKRLVSHGWTRVGEPLEFDGYRLTYTAIRRGGDLLVHRDRGYALLWTALVAALMPTPIPVDLVTVARGPLRVTLDHEGQTRVRDRYVVSAPVPGRCRTRGS